MHDFPSGSYGVPMELAVSQKRFSNPLAFERIVDSVPFHGQHQIVGSWHP